MRVLCRRSQVPHPTARPLGDRESTGEPRHAPGGTHPRVPELLHVWPPEHQFCQGQVRSLISSTKGTLQ